MQHKTVLLHEAVEGLLLSTDSVVVDATFGAGGHAAEIISHLSEEGTYIGIDADKTALPDISSFDTKATVHLVNDNFRNIREVVGSLQHEYVNAILADLGWRMEQFSGSGKGFSFQHDEPLIMTFGEPIEHSFTAEEIVNEWDEQVIANILFGYAEERFSRRIAKAIVETRKKGAILSTKQLADIVSGALPAAARHGKIHPATKTFQALRIAVNDELAALEQLINQGFACLAPEGRMAIITFHSIEDRIVKHAFREKVQNRQAVLVNKKPIVPSGEELKENPRARSAKLRIIQKTT